jgi:hypothetical protein
MIFITVPVSVGVVLLKTGMGNFFKGQIGGLAVFDRALNK